MEEWKFGRGSWVFAKSWSSATLEQSLQTPEHIEGCSGARVFGFVASEAQHFQALVLHSCIRQSGKDLSRQACGDTHLFLRHQPVWYLGSSDRKLFSWSISPSANHCLLAENRNFAGSPSWIHQENRVVCRQHLDVSSILLLPWSLKTPCLLLQHPPICFEQENGELS